MADWTTITDTQVDPDAPLTSQLAYGWRDNVIAAREGAVNSPYERSGWHPYNGVTIGDGATGVIYDFAVHGAVASVVSPDFEDGYEYMLVMSGIDSSGAVDNFYIEAYKETSGAYLTLVTNTYAPSLVNDLAIRLELYWPRVTSIRAFTSGNISGVAVSPAQKLLRFRVRFNIWNIAGGTIRMMRRLAF